MSIVTKLSNKFFGILWKYTRAGLLAMKSVPSAYSAFSNGETYESYRGFVDYLTGLLNRRAFDRDLNSVNGVVSVIYLDLDNFRYVNNTFGHQPGDIYLQTVATALSEFTSESGRCYRIGGDEMAVILSPFVDGGAFKVKLETYIKERYGFSVSIGCAVGESAAALRISESKMYHSKNRKKGKGMESSKMMYVPSKLDKRSQTKDRRQENPPICLN